MKPSTQKVLTVILAILSFPFFTAALINGKEMIVLEKEPELEETPTARDILTPIINLLPFTNEFNIGSRSASCPVVEFSVFNHQYRIDSHCPLIEQNRGAVETICLIIWGFVALRIILSA